MNNKKVLIIAYYWPPAGGPGVQRWLKFVKYLPEYGIEPIVYIPENPNYPIVDETLNSEVSSNLTIIKNPISEPYKWASLFSGKTTKTISSGIITETKQQSFIEKILLYIRGNFFIPDARKAWVKPSIAFLENYVIKQGIKTVITTGPPHSMHLIGLALKEQLNMNWLADFRDPWTTIGYHKKLRLNKRSKAKHKVLESQVLLGADQVLVTSFTTKKEFENLTQKPIEVITNGYDIELNDALIKLDTKFTIAHIGSLLSKRNPLVLWEVLKELVQEQEGFSEDLSLSFVGTISNEVISTITNYNLNKYVKVIGYVPHKEALKLQRQSQVLLLVEIDSEETKCIIPGKLFEYMAARRPIIAIGPENSDIEVIISKTQTGHYFNYNDFTLLKNVILEHYNAFKKQQLVVKSKDIEMYSRRSLTKKLAALISNI